MGERRCAGRATPRPHRGPRPALAARRARAAVELTGHDGSKVAVYSRAQLQTVTSEIHDHRVPDTEKVLLRQARTVDGYRRLDHALNNQRDVPPILADHVSERLGPRPAGDDRLASGWDRLVATALSDHAETGTLGFLENVLRFVEVVRW